MWFDAENIKEDASMNLRRSKKQIAKFLSNYSEIDTYKVHQSCTSFAALCVLNTHYFHSSTTNKIKNKYIRGLLMTPLNTIFNLIGLIFLLIPQKNPTMYIDSIIEIKLKT